MLFLARLTHGKDSILAFFKISNNPGISAMEAASAASGIIWLEQYYYGGTGPWYATAGNIWFGRQNIRIAAANFDMLNYRWTVFEVKEFEFQHPMEATNPAGFEARFRKHSALWVDEILQRFSH